MKNIRRKLLSQNFLCNRPLVERLVCQSSIRRGDLVVEIGAGQGIITQELIKRAGHVVAVEIDAYWYRRLQEQMAGVTSLTLYQADILSFDLPRLPYKVFANIPFAIEGKIIRKLLDDAHPPQDCYLVVMKELAERLVASQPSTLFAVSYRPWFDFSIEYRFKVSDFRPEPTVKAVLLRFTKKATPLLPWAGRRKYQNFVKVGFGQGLAVRNNLKSQFSTHRIDQVLHDLSISRKARPQSVDLASWLEMYRNMS